MNEQKAKPRTMDEMSQLVVAGEESRKNVPRFIPSGLNVPGYEQTRIRRFQRNQVSAVIAGLDKFGVRTKASLAEKIPSNELLQFKVTRFVQSCLVGPEKPVGPAQLFRKGELGFSRLKQDLSVADVVHVLSKACDQVGVLQDEPEPTEVDGVDGSDEADEVEPGSD